MRVCSFSYRGAVSFGVVDGHEVRDCGASDQHEWISLRDVLAQGGLAALEAASKTAPKLALADVTLLPPIADPEKIFCIGGNYSGHLAEAAAVHDSTTPKKPIVFVRFSDTQIGEGAAILRPPESEMLDFEGELVVVIGKAGRRIPEAQALDHVAGYSIYNDATLRDYQLHTSQFTPGKNFPNTGAFGPWIVTSDELPDAGDLELITRLNGEVVQQSSTSKLIYGVQAIIAFLSTFTELRPGDLIITGTPEGVGYFRKPQLWMKPGDAVEVEISKIGVLHNCVADE